MNNQKHVAVIGAGYWGKNLVRNFHQQGVLKSEHFECQNCGGNYIKCDSGIKGTICAYQK